MESCTSVGSVCETGSGMQPYVIIVDDSLASTAMMPTAAAVPEGGGEDGYRTVLEIIACSTHRALEYSLPVTA